uniref:Protein S100-A1 n=1 Tax=Equus caballus TaxID=9796 RepID=A0A9L0RKX8_HORSE
NNSGRVPRLSYSLRGPLTETPQRTASVPCLAATANTAGGRRRPLSVPPRTFPTPLPPGPCLLGTSSRGRQPRLEKRTQGSLFQPRRQRAPLSTPGPLPHWVSASHICSFGCLSRTCSHLRPRLTVSCAMGSELETAMETLISVFHAHSGKEGDKYKLSKKELKELLQTELSGFLDAQKDADAVDKVMKELDENGDGEVDFQEYVVLVAALTVACNNFFWENS